MRESHEMRRGEALHLGTEQLQEARGVNICVVKSTHMDGQSIVCCSVRVRRDSKLIDRNWGR